MRVVAHLSDIHFGAIDYDIVEPLIEAVNDAKPDLVAVSGDLTQRARSHQFNEAREFLDRLPWPQIVVPGNHDIPLYNVFRRFVGPLAKYRRYISDDLQPFFVDNEIAVAGVNTARSLTIKGGRINEVQIGWVRGKFCALSDKLVKFVVTHHPFDLPAGHRESDIVGRAPLAIKGLAECGADVFLAGHMHISHTGHTAQRYKTSGHSALVVQAGTAASTRGRGQANSFNIIRVDGLRITVERFLWQSDISKFVSDSSESFHREGSTWLPDF